MTTTTDATPRGDDVTSDRDVVLGAEFAADADLMASLEGDEKGLREVQALARAEEVRARR